MNIVLFSETIYKSVAVFIKAAGKIAGNANI